jgi:hypothetical protein
MSHFRYSIASLLGLVLFVAVAFAALRQADDLWDSAVFSLTVGLFLASVLHTVHRTGRRRAFWLGFAVVGWAYLIARLVPPVESRLLTTKGLAYLDSKIPGRDPTLRLAVRWRNSGNVVSFSPDGRVWGETDRQTIRIWNATTGRLLSGPSATSEDFVRIGHSLLALVLAFVGGQLSRWLFDRERDGQPGGSTVPATDADIA